MWLYTEKGFLSVVAFDPKLDTKNKRSNRQVKSWGPRPVLVRGRIEAHLEQLRPFWSKLKIEKDDSADYEFRAVMPRSRWNDFLMAAGDAIDYDSHFKEVVKKRSPGSEQDKNKLYTAMMRVWNAMADIQPDAPYSGAWKNWKGGAGKGYTYYGNGSGYTAKGVKSAADSAAVFTSGGTPVGGTFSGRSGYYDPDLKKWVETGGYEVDRTNPNHYGTTNYKESSDQVSGQLSASGNVEDAPESVEDMCKALVMRAPDAVFVDMATPAPAYDLWCRAQEEFTVPLRADDISYILEELVEDPTVTREAENEYQQMLHKLYASMGLGIVEEHVAEQQLALDYEARTQTVARNLLADAGL
jgi:hypothetical protein